MYIGDTVGTLLRYSGIPFIHLMHASRYISAYIYIYIYIADTVGILLRYSGIPFIYLMQAAVSAANNGSSPQPSLEDCTWVIVGN